MAYAQADKKYGEQEAVSEEKAYQGGEKKHFPATQTPGTKSSLIICWTPALRSTWYVHTNSIHLLQNQHLGNQAMVTFKRVLVLFVPRTEFVVYGAHW